MKLIPIFILTITFSLSSIAGKVEHQVKENWEQWGPYKLKAVQIGMGEIDENIHGYIGGSSMDLSVTAEHFVKGFSGLAYDSTAGGGTDFFFFDLWSGNVENRSRYFSFSPKKDWLQKIIVKENYHFGEPGIQFLRFRGDGFDGKFGTNPGKDYIEKSVVSFADANREFSYAPILINLNVYADYNYNVLAGFRMTFLIPEHVKVRHSQNVSVNYF